jgi:hypothetical protein
MAHPDFQGSLTTVAIAKNERFGQAQSLGKGGEVVRHQTIAEFAAGVVRPTMTTTVRHYHPEMFFESGKMWSPTTAYSCAAV